MRAPAVVAAHRPSHSTDPAVTSEPAAPAVTQVNVVGITNHPRQDFVLFRVLVRITCTLMLLGTFIT